MPEAGTSNPQCRQSVSRVQDATPETYYAMGVVIKYGSFRMLDLSDLTWNQEKDLVCPNNLLGTNFDVYNTSRHGTDFAGNPVLVYTARPRVAVKNNSPTIREELRIRSGSSRAHPDSSTSGNYITRRTWARMLTLRMHSSRNSTRCRRITRHTTSSSQRAPTAALPL